MYKPLEIFSDLSERMKYNLPDFPVCAYKGSMHFYDSQAFAYHWHTDLEFVLILEGSMEYLVNGRTVHLDGGDAIFVNSKRLHRGYSAKPQKGSYIVVTVHPTLLGANTLVGKAYLDRKFGSAAEDYVRLSPKISWQREIIRSIVSLCEQMREDSDNLLRLLARSTELCASIAEHLQDKPPMSADADRMAILQEMTGYIHQRYEAKIAIDEIAAAGSVCRSRCCQLFKKHLHLSPNNYLIQYRIQKSCEMLKETNRPVSEIALACGFQSASYFANVFRKQIGDTPQEFRKKSVV